MVMLCCRCSTEVQVEDATTIQKGTWGYQRNTNINGYFTTDELIDLLVTVVRYGLYGIEKICVSVVQNWLHNMVLLKP